jgi:hypothetical protein
MLTTKVAPGVDTGGGEATLREIEDNRYELRRNSWFGFQAVLRFVAQRGEGEAII